MWKAAAVMCALFVASVLGALGGYELYLRKRFAPQFQDWQMHILNQPLVYYPEIDDFFKRPARQAERGMFKPNETFITNYVKGSSVALKTVAHTNSLGFLSNHPYAVERDAGRPEFRVAIFGDSMTGVVTATRQWIDYLEKILNASPSLRALVNGREFRVLNFGAPGMGFPHFWGFYNAIAKQFDPDMLVVNYIELDFPRTEPSNGKYYVSDTAGQIAQAVDIFSRFVDAQPHVLFTLMPLLEDLTDFPKYERTEAVLKQVPAAPHKVMRELMMGVGGATSKSEYRDWYNWPKAEDGHMSDRGNDIYARTMALVLGEYLSAHVATQPFDKDRVAAEVAGTQPDLETEDATRMHVTSNPEYLTRLRQNIIEPTIAGRMPLIRSALWDKLPHRPADPFDRNQSPLPIAIAGHVPVRYGPGDMDLALLNLACIHPPLAIDNRHCYHNFILYAE